MSQGDDGRSAVEQRRIAAIPNDLYGQLQPGGDSQTQIASRPTFTELQLEDAYNMRMTDQEKKSRKQQLMAQRRAGKESKTTTDRAKAVLTRILPCIKVFTTYKLKDYAVFDLLSGLSVGMFAIPQAIAFALLANVKPQYGFYSAFFAMTIYFIFGSSSHLNMTHQGAVSLLVGEAVRAGVQQAYGGQLCESSNMNITTTMPATTAAYNFRSSNSSESCVDPDDANISVSVTLTMIVGALQLVLGFLRFGFITIYLSDPLNSAFTCGAALHILSSQLANMLGTKIPPIKEYAKFFLYFVEALKKIFDLEINMPTIAVFIGFFAALLAVKMINERCSKYVKIPIPIDMIVLVSSLLLSSLLDWETNLKVDIVGNIPRGFEAPRTPKVEHFSSGSGILVDGIVLGIIGYSLSVSVAKTFAVRHGYEVDASQEMIAYGAVNFGMSWFNTFPSASSIACTSLHESMKGRTLLYTVYAAIITLLGILLLAPIFSSVPKCVLSAIIIVNLKSMLLQFEQLPRLWKTNKYDFAIWIVTLAAILGLDLPTGLLAGVVFSLATVIFRSQAPKAYLVGRLPKTDIYKNIKKNKTAEEIEGLRIFKFDGSVYFASAENFRQRLYRQVAMNPKKILAKAQALAKKEGSAEGLKITTEVVNAEDIRRELDRVQQEGMAMDQTERRKAQQIANSASSNSLDWLPDEDEDDKTPPAVNVFCIILDLSACAFTDAVGVRLLTQIVEDFNKIGVEIYLSGCSAELRSQLRRGQFFKKRDETGVFVTVHDAVLYALATFYKELIDEEQDISRGVDYVDAVNEPTLVQRASVIRSTSEGDGRQLRRQARKISRRMSHERTQSASRTHNAQNAEQQKPSSEGTTNGQDNTVVARPLPVFDIADADEDADGEAALQDNIYDNHAYEYSDNTEL